MARIPNSSDASSMWKLNDVYVAQNGGEWPPTYLPPPNYADGYVSRYTGWSNGDNPSNNNMVNNWGPFFMSTNQYDAICVRCTTHDWTLQRVQQGNGMNANNGGTHRFQVMAWAGTQVNTGTALLDSGQDYLNMGWNYSPTNSTMLPTAPSWGESTAVLTANQWYTVGIGYWLQSNAGVGQSYNGNGYGSYYTSTTMTCSASNANGTTTISSNWEFQSITGGGGSGIWNSQSTATANQGPLGMFQVKVWQ